MLRRPLLILLALLACAVAYAEEEGTPKAKARNGGYLGIFIRETAPGVVRVERVHPGSGAEKEGLKAGDVIEGVGGRPLANGDQLIRRLWSSRPYTLKIKRGEEAVEIRTSTKALDRHPEVGAQAPRFKLMARDRSGVVSTRRGFS